ARADLEGAGAPERAVELVPRAFLHQQVDALLRADAAVMPAVRADVQGPDEAVLDVDVPALVAFLPGVGWNLQLGPFGGAGLALFFEPGHSRHRMWSRRRQFGSARGRAPGQPRTPV